MLLRGAPCRKDRCELRESRRLGKPLVIGNSRRRVLPRVVPKSEELLRSAIHVTAESVRKQTSDTTGMTRSLLYKAKRQGIDLLSTR